jgi:hypothetical protein
MFVLTSWNSKGAETVCKCRRNGHLSQSGAYAKRSNFCQFLSAPQRTEPNILVEVI